jgi:hypothetical protein
MATYNTEVRSGGETGRWIPNGPLELEIVNGKKIVPGEEVAPSAGTTVSWSGHDQSASIIFNDALGNFFGSLTNSGGGPLDYRGSLLK